MAKDWMKFIEKSGKKKPLMNLIQKLFNGEFEELDIKSLSGNKGLFRCRLGDVRVVFSNDNGKIMIHKIGNRGDIYKSI